MSRSSSFTFAERAVRFPPRVRRLLLIGVDALFLPLAVWLSFWLRLAHPFHPNFQAAGLWLVPTVLLVGLPIYAVTGQYRGLTRYVGSRALYGLAVRNGLLVTLLVTIGLILALPMPPQSSWILLCCCLLDLQGCCVLPCAICFCLCARLGTTDGAALFTRRRGGAQLCSSRLAGNHQIITYMTHRFCGSDD